MTHDILQLTTSSAHTSAAE